MENGIKVATRLIRMAYVITTSTATVFQIGKTRISNIGSHFHQEKRKTAFLVERFRLECKYRKQNQYQVLIFFTANI